MLIPPSALFWGFLNRAKWCCRLSFSNRRGTVYHFAVWRRAIFLPMSDVKPTFITMPDEAGGIQTAENGVRKAASARSVAV